MNSPRLTPNASTGMKTVLVLGASYAGARCARLLSELLHKEEDDGLGSWRVVVVDRNSHANHVYVFPRFTVLPQHGPKAFIPYSNLLFQSNPSTCSSSTPSSNDINQNLFIRGQVLSVDNKSVKIQLIPDGAKTKSDSASSSPGRSSYDGSRDQVDLPYEYLVYALGSTLPEPVDPWCPLFQLSPLRPAFPSRTSEGQVITRSLKELDLNVSLPSQRSPRNSLVGQTLPPRNEALRSGRSRRSYSESEKFLPGRKVPGSKEFGVEWMNVRESMIRKAGRIVVLGGGALGIQFATDIKELFPEKQVTLVHSRDRLMPLYPAKMHEIVVDRCKDLGIDLILGERAQSIDLKVDLDEGKRSRYLVTTSKGKELEADLVLPCTGQKPNVEIISRFLPSSLDASNGRISIRPTMQLSPSSLLLPEDPIEDRIFAIGDSANAFGATQSGNAAYWQAEVAARNVWRLIRNRDSKGTREKEELELYEAKPPAIKVTLGLTKYVKCHQEAVVVGNDGQEDLAAESMWLMFGAADLVHK